MKKKTLNVEDIIKIIEVVNRQQYLTHIQHDKDGIIKFTNDVACRNIRDGIFQFLDTVLDEDFIPFEESYELNDNGIESYRKEHHFYDTPEAMKSNIKEIKRGTRLFCINADDADKSLVVGENYKVWHYKRDEKTVKLCSGHSYWSIDRFKIV